MRTPNYYNSDSEAEGAMAVVAGWIAKNRKIDVVYHNGTAVDADIYKGRIRIPRMACASGISHEALMLLRHQVYHESRHISDTDLPKSEMPKGALFNVLNAIEDRRIENVGSKEHAGEKEVFSWSMGHYNKKIAEKKLKEGSLPPLWEALCAMGFQSLGVTPAWDLGDKAQAYFDKAYDVFVEWYKCKNTREAKVLAQRVYDLLKEACDEYNEENPQQSGWGSGDSEDGDEDESQPAPSGSGEEDDKPQAGSGRPNDIDDDEDEKDGSGSGDEDEDGDENGESGDSGDEEGESGDSGDEEGESGEGDDSGGPGSGSEEDSEDGEEGKGKGKGKGNEGSEDGDEGSEEDSEGSDSGNEDKDGDPNARNDTKNNRRSRKGTPEPQTEGGGAGKQKSPLDIEKQLEEDLKGGETLEEMVNEDLEQIFKGMDPKDKDYTSLRDNDIHYTPDHGSQDKQDFVERRKQVTASVAAMTRALEQALRAMNRNRREGYKIHGKIDKKRLTALAKSLHKDVFFQTRNGIQLNTAVEIIIDESGSMGWKELEIQLLAIALGEGMKQIGVPFEITGTTTQYGFGDSPELNGFTRTNPIVFKHYKKFEEDWMRVRHRIVNTSSHMHNVDGEAVEYCAFRLAQRPEQRKVIFSLSDGCPQSGHGNDHKMGANLQRVCERVRKAGIEVYGFGIGTDNPKRYYGEKFFIYLEEVGQMGQDFLRSFVKIITGGKVRV